MNFVIYSYNFFPQADAESFCATRFASALARAGHKVTVVTMDWSNMVSRKTYDALVSKDLNIVRIPFSTKKNSPIKALLWYGHRSQMAVDVPQSIEVLKSILRKTEEPILVTRTAPVMSTMVGLKTYKYAHKWIAHFSDPIPWIGAYSNSVGHRLLKEQEMNILHKAFCIADGISVTCMHVCKYFQDLYGEVFDMRKVFMTTHIGDYRLDSEPSHEENTKVERTLLHPGTMYAYRGGSTICDVMKQLAIEDYDCKFIQIGEVDVSIKKALANSDNIEVYNSISAEKSVELRKKAKAIFVPDFESELTYSPFILSKFVYQIMSNKPIVLYAKEDSEMHDYAIKYPEAGIFWAKANNEDALKEAIKKAMDFDVAKIDRMNIRKCFSEEVIASGFVNNIRKLNEKK